MDPDPGAFVALTGQVGTSSAADLYSARTETVRAGGVVRGVVGDAQRLVLGVESEKLRDAVNRYTAALAADNGYRDADKISAQLATWGLNGRSFVQT